jgi:cytochrome P450
MSKDQPMGIAQADLLRQLRQELDQAVEERGSKDMISFQEAQKLPYLQAVIKEGLRLHSATGLPLVRVVPKGGAMIAGRYFPEKVRAQYCQSQ